MQRRSLTDSRRVVAYYRASTDDQRLSPEAQRAAVEAWAAAQGLEIVASFVDQGVSGGADLEDRPGLLAALAALRTLRASTLAIARRDRLARDVMVAAMVERKAAQVGARVVSADGTGNGDSPADAFMRTVLDGAAAYERALIRARTKSALAVKRERGERISGRVPFGYRVADDGVHLVADQAEQGVLAVVRELREAGLSERAIVGALAARGLVSRTGQPFAKTQVHNMLTKGAA